MISFVLIAAIMAQLPAGLQNPPAAEPSPDRVEIVLFTDFQCPFCARSAGSFRELQTKGVEGVETTARFKHFPLGIHPDAPLAHQAALSAGEQGKFWEMHDLLFANQSALKRDDLLGYAAKLGLNLSRFGKDLDSDRLKQIIDADKSEGQKLGVNGTPTFFLNGKAYSGARSFDQLKELVQGDQRRRQAVTEITENLMSKGPADAPVTLELFATYGAR